MAKLLASVSFILFLFIGQSVASNALLPSHPGANNTIIDEEKAYLRVEQMPEFGEGGNAAKNVMKYIKENLKYPQEAFDNKIEGTVPIKFIVEKDGSIGQVIALKDPGYGLVDEAILVIKKMPKWKPGKQQDNLVRVWFTVPIVFKLKKIDN
ncbi:MAG: energy transducer TonB [Saprospiraceae bacterium]|nr:energy transducer TonB [Saprospiraceae bacterium]